MHYLTHTASGSPFSFFIIKLMGGITSVHNGGRRGEGSRFVSRPFTHGKYIRTNFKTRHDHTLTFSIQAACNPSPCCILLFLTVTKQSLSVYGCFIKGCCWSGIQFVEWYVMQSEEMGGRGGVYQIPPYHSTCCLSLFPCVRALLCITLEDTSLQFFDYAVHTGGP